MRLPNLCLGVLSLAGTIAAPQNYGKGLRRFGIVWSHLTQYKKFGVQPVLLIPPSCLLGYNLASLQLNQT